MKKIIASIILVIIMLSGAMAQNENIRPGSFDYIGASYKTFSVSDTKKVQFSRGNLQYNAAQDQWRFAPRQYTTVCAGNANAAADYDGWIDLFGWGTSGWNSGAVEYQPWSTSTTNTDYVPGGDGLNDLAGDYANADWGVYNKISNGGNGKGMWRTLTNSEWRYLLCHGISPAVRRNKKGLGTLGGIYTGMIILPDEWELPSGLSFTPGEDNEFQTNTYSFNEWSRMEAAGAVFLPCGGNRSTSQGLTGAFENGNYWSSSCYGSGNTHAIQVRFARNISGRISCDVPGCTRSCANSVRLVRDERSAREAFDESGASYKTFSVSENAAVRFSKGNLQYNAAQDTWRFAARQYLSLGAANANAAADYNGWIDLFGWGTSGWNSCVNAYQPWSTSTTLGDYLNDTMDLTGDYVKSDWGINNKINNGGDQKGKWRTLTGDEWRYLIGDNAARSGKWGYATINSKYHGVVLLPDEWSLPSGLSFTPGAGNVYSTNIYTLDDWKRMESAGAIFLPAGGQRSGTTVTTQDSYNHQSIGYYWSSWSGKHSTDGGSATNDALYMGINDGNVFVQDENRYIGNSVRLVWNDLEVDTSNTGCSNSEPQTSGEWIDMGLPSGTQWYSVNIGASAPEEYGSYFAWGETTTKGNYTWDTYRYGTSANTLTKYCNDASSGLDGFTDTLTVLVDGDDAARAALGSESHMPTEAEWQELIDNCAGVWTTQNGVNGWKFTSNANGNSLFLPAATFMAGSSLGNLGLGGDYWSSSLSTDNPGVSMYFGFASDGSSITTAGRQTGFSVRAVKSGTPTTSGAFDADGASVKTFSVSESSTVNFSKGNLQYNAAQDTWRFAENQWDTIGAANNNISSSYNGWIDMFGWGTSGWNSGANEYQPWATSTTYADYYPGGSYENSLTGAYANADWGVYNAISNGGNQAGMWRTMTKDEWEYLLNTRAASTVSGIENARFTKATVGGVSGVIILPDSFTLPAGVGELVNINNPDVDYTGNTYTTEQWAALETAGAIFLPAAGYRNSPGAEGVGTYGHYWSSTYGNENYAFSKYFSNDGLYMYGGNRDGGRTVRLVKATEQAGTSEAFDADGASVKTFSVSASSTVNFSKGNLQYNAAQDTWRFAENQYDYVGNDNSNISSSYDGWIDLFGWGTSGWNSGANEYQPWASSTTDEDYYPGGSWENHLTGAYANADWGVYNAISNGGNAAGMWRTLTHDEWVYLIDTRSASTVGGVENARYAKATVGGVAGVIILPDDFTMPAGVTELVNINTTDAAYSGNTYTTEDWANLETAGAIFLPAAGYRSGVVLDVGTSGCYWSSTYYDEGNAWGMNCYGDILFVNYNNRNDGQSVRLVKY